MYNHQNYELILILWRWWLKRLLLCYGGVSWFSPDFLSQLYVIAWIVGEYLVNKLFRGQNFLLNDSIKAFWYTKSSKIFYIYVYLISYMKKECMLPNSMNRNNFLKKIPLVKRVNQICLSILFIQSLRLNTKCFTQCCFFFVYILSISYF